MYTDKGTGTDSTQQTKFRTVSSKNLQNGYLS